MVLIAMACKDNYEYLRRTIKSLGKCNFPKDSRLVIADSSSDQRCIDLLDKIDFVKTEIWRGYKDKSYNEVLHFLHMYCMSEPYFIKIDSDFLFHPDIFNIMIEGFEKYKDKFDIAQVHTYGCLNCDDNEKPCKIIDLDEEFFIRKWFGGTPCLINSEFWRGMETFAYHNNLWPQWDDLSNQLLNNWNWCNKNKKAWVCIGTKHHYGHHFGWKGLHGEIPRFISKRYIGDLKEAEETLNV